MFGKDNLLPPRNIRQHLYKLTPLSPLQTAGIVSTRVRYEVIVYCWVVGEQCSGWEDGYCVEVKVWGER